MAHHEDRGGPIDNFLAALGGVLTHRLLIVALNLAIAYIVFLLFSHYAGHLDGTEAHNKEIGESLTGVGVVLIGWGVALEERCALRHIFRMPDMESPKETWIDDLCHYYGVGLLLMGLFAEVFVELVKLPNEIVNTAGKDEIVLGLAGAMVGACFIMLLTFSWTLIRAKPSGASETVARESPAQAE